MSDLPQDLEDIIPGDSLAYVELACRPNVQLASVVREFVSSFYKKLFIANETVGFVALATHELLENAIRYAIDGETTIRIEVSKASDERGLVSIRTWNRATPENQNRLAKIFEEIACVPDPFEYYQTILRRTKEDGESGLGLGRVRAEADMSLDWGVDENGRVSVHATCEVELSNRTLGVLQ